MEGQQRNQPWHQLEVSANDFRQRMQQSDALNGGAVPAADGRSVYSRLALIHQVAKAYAQEASRTSGNSAATIEIEEITNPPLYDLDDQEEPVLIQFSYPNEA